MLRNKRSQHNEKPTCYNYTKPVHSNKDPVKQKIKNKKIKKRRTRKK